jgi:hypothetical protein
MCRLSFLDRTNIGNARLAGLEASLGMKGLAYNVSMVLSQIYHVLTIKVECVGRLLPFLCPSGGTIQPHDEGHPPFNLDPHYNGRLGYRVRRYGSGQELQRLNGCALFSRSGGRRVSILPRNFLFFWLTILKTIPRGYLLYYYVVQTGKHDR